MKDSLEQIKFKIEELTRVYSREAHSKYNQPSLASKDTWKPGEPIPYAGRVFGEDEVVAAVSSALEFWLTLGSQGKSFQKELSDFLGIKDCILVNSGSSANLIALSAILTSPLSVMRSLSAAD